MSRVVRTVVVLGSVLGLPRAQSAPLPPVPVEPPAISTPRVPEPPGVLDPVAQEVPQEGDAVADLRRAVERVRRASLTPAERAAAARELRRLAEQLGGPRGVSKPGEPAAANELMAPRMAALEYLARAQGDANEADRAKMHEHLMRLHEAGNDADREDLHEHLMRLHGASEADREKLHEHLRSLQGGATGADRERLDTHLRQLAELEAAHGDEAAARHFHELYREGAERAAVNARDHAEAAELEAFARAHGHLYGEEHGLPVRRAPEPFGRADRAAVEAERAHAGPRARRAAPGVPAVPAAPFDPLLAEVAAPGEPAEAPQPPQPPAPGTRRRARAPGGEAQVDELRQMVEEMRAEMAAVRELLDAIRAERGRGRAR